jgi:zinc D-Ala-D-Ala carboxypeptidase
MKLSPHFTLAELTDSTTAARNSISNDPPLEVVANLKRTAGVLEQVRVVLNASPIQVTSGFRGEELEKVICASAYRAWCQRKGLPVSSTSWAQYFEAKDHPKGNAADIKAPSFGTPEQVMHAIYNSNIEYDQLILEFGQWVHISVSDRNRRQALVIDNKGTRNYP